MGATKIYVLQMKGILKAAAVVLVGLILILLFAHFFAPGDEEVKDSAEVPYTPGTYTSKIILHNSPVRVDVTVSESEILSIELNDLRETQEIFYPLLRPTLNVLSQEIIENQTLDVALTRDSAVTEEILLSAVKDALEKARMSETASY